MRLITSIQLYCQVRTVFKVYRQPGDFAVVFGHLESRSVDSIWIDNVCNRLVYVARRQNQVSA